MFKIQKRKVKCKNCKKELYNTEAYQVTEGTKKSYYCTEDEYKEIQNEKLQYNNCLETVAKIINSKFVTPIMIKKINELRQFYDYQIIERTFKECQQSIGWSLENRDFNNEFAKTKYIVSIVANNIQNIDKKVSQERKQMERLFRKDTNIDIDVMDTSTSRDIQNKSVSDISEFLD